MSAVPRKPKKSSSRYLYTRGVDRFGNIPQGAGPAWAELETRDSREDGLEGGGRDTRDDDLGFAARGSRGDGLRRGGRDTRDDDLEFATRDSRDDGLEGGGRDTRDDDLGFTARGSRGDRSRSGGRDTRDDDLGFATSDSRDDGLEGGGRDTRDDDLEFAARDSRDDGLEGGGRDTRGFAARVNLRLPLERREVLVRVAEAGQPQGRNPDSAMPTTPGKAANATPSGGVGRSYARNADKGSDCWGSLYGAGHVPDLPDPRDKAAFGKFLEACRGQRRLGLNQLSAETARADMDVAIGPVSHQGPVQSSVAHVVASLAEHAAGKPDEQLSVLFLYKLGREMAGIKGDRGISFRQALRALARYGCLLETEWPHEARWVEMIPGLQDLQAAAPRRGLSYACLDDWEGSGENTLKRVVDALKAGRPVGFGLPLYRCIDDIDSKGHIPLPKNDRSGGLLASQAVMAVGYEPKRGTGNRGKLQEGDLIIRNSWGPEWADQGYARLPAKYVTKRLARDFWVVYGQMEGGDDLRP